MINLPAHTVIFAWMFLSWMLFVMAAVNIVFTTVRYVRDREIFGWPAIVRWLYYAALLAGWQYIQSTL